MPRRSLHNPDADHRPAFGLKDDVLDQELREETASRESREELQELRKRRPRVRKSEDVYDIDDDYIASQLMQQYREALDRPVYDWRRSNRITSTEVAAVCGAGLLRSVEVTSNVKAFLSGHELTRDDQPLDVQEFLEEKLGFLPKAQRKWEWEGNYSLPGIRHKLVLTRARRGPRLAGHLRRRWHLTIFFCGGRIKSDGKAEAGMVRELFERARIAYIRRPHNTVMHGFGICVPRSADFRKAILAEKKKPREFLEFEPAYLMVERVSGEVIGLKEMFEFDS